MGILVHLLEIIRRFVPDDVATANDMAAIRRARGEYRRGETVSHEEIIWD